MAVLELPVSHKQKNPDQQISYVNTVKSTKGL